jgi:hypothetical protein
MSGANIVQGMLSRTATGCLNQQSSKHSSKSYITEADCDLLA